MLRLDAERPVSFCDGWTRRDFLHAGSLATLGLTLPGWSALRAAGAAKDTAQEQGKEHASALQDSAQQSACDVRQQVGS